MTYLITDNRTGFIYKTTEENVLEQSVSVLPAFFKKLSILLGDNPDAKITDVFNVDLSYYTRKMYSYKRIPKFNWINILLEDNDLGPIARGMSPYKMLKRIKDHVVKTKGGRIVYITRTGNIASKPLFASTIEYRDSIIGIYRAGYTDLGLIGATLITDSKEVDRLISFYNSKCRK